MTKYECLECTRIGLFFCGYPAWHLSREEERKRQEEEMLQLDNNVKDQALEKKTVSATQSHQMVGVEG